MILKVKKSLFKSEASFNYFCKLLERKLDLSVSYSNDGINLRITNNEEEVVSKIKNLIKEFNSKDVIFDEREKMDYLYNKTKELGYVPLSDKNINKFWTIINKRTINSYKLNKSVSKEELETIHTLALIEKIKRESNVKKLKK